MTAPTATAPWINCYHCGDHAWEPHYVKYTDGKLRPLCEDCADDDGAEPDYAEARQSEYDAEYPGYPDWMQTEMEARNRPGGY